MPTELCCPRCGYDMRAATAHWNETCPVDGTCSECGLVFHWVEVIQPERFVPWWWPEGTGRGRWIRRALVTWFMALRPRRFWDAAQLSTRPRPWRMAGCFLIVLLAVVMLYVGVQGASAARLWIMVREMIRPVFPQGSTPQMPELVAVVVDAVTRPLAEASNLTRMGNLKGWFAPMEIHRCLDDGITRGLTGGGGPPVTVSTLSVVLWMVMVDAAALLITPFLFILLPMTRRKAKVQWRHFARVGVLSFLLPLWAVAAYLIALGIGAAIPDYRLSVLRIATVIILVSLPLWTVLWWTRAVGRYLRMPHAFAVAISLLFIAVFLPVGLTALVGRMDVVLSEMDRVSELFEFGFFW